MAVFETWLKNDLKKPLNVEYLNGNIFSQDNQGNLIGVEVFDDGEEATLSGSVSANIIRADGSTVAQSGTLSGNKCSIVLPQAAYAVPGILTIVIKLTTSGVITTVAAAVATVYRSSTDTIVDPGTIIPSVQALISQIETAIASIPADYSSLLADLAPSYSQKVWHVGEYCWQDGDLKRCKTEITTAESYNSAHWESAVFGVDLYNESVARKQADNDLKSALNTVMIGNNLFVDGVEIDTSTGKWKANNTSSFYIFPVCPNDEIFFSGNNYSVYYAFLKSYSFCVPGETPDYATGYSNIIYSSYEFKKTAPVDAKYLFVMNKKSGTIILPKWIKNKEYNYLLANTENYQNNASNIVNTTNYQTSGYINVDGSLITGGTWITSEYFPFDGVKDIYLKAYQIPGTVAIASFYDSSKNFVYAIDVVSGASGNGDKLGYIDLSNVPSTAKFVRFSTNNSEHFAFVNYDLRTLVVGNYAKATEAQSNMINTVVRIEGNSFLQNGFVVYADGSIHEGANFVYTDYMSAKNVLSIRSKSYQYEDTVAIVAFYDINKSFISAVDTYDGQSGNGIKEGSVNINQIPSNAYFMRFSSYTSVSDKYVQVKYDYSKAIAEVLDTVPALESEMENIDLYSTRLCGYPFSMAFIGDSLTHGQTYRAAQGTENYAYKNKANYPDAFCRLMDIDTKTVIAIPGANPGDVWSSKQAEIEAILNQFVIVWLGTNGGLTDTVDTDCVGDDVTQYANTNTGNYGKIIKTLVDHGNKVFLAQLCYTTHSATSNPVIVDLAERFECAVIELTPDDIADLNQDKYHTAYNGYVNSVHFNSIGYNHVAGLFFQKMMKTVFANPEDFEIYMVDT